MGAVRAPPLPPASGGYTVAYNAAEGVAVTVYVYNRGLARVPNDLSAKEVQAELAGAKDAVQEARRLGIYEDVREEKTGEATLGGGKDARKALYARFRLRADKRDAVSEIYVFPHRDHFIKVRVTRPADGPDTIPAALDRLWAGLNPLFAK